MSTTSSMEASMQPKFKCCVFESDKDSKSFLTWLRLISGIIRNMLGGNDLEEFLDSYLNRGLHTSSTRPAFLGDPRLNFTPSASASSRPQQPREEGEDDSGGGGGAHEEAHTARVFSYSDLSDDAVRLDKALYNTLYTIVKGSFLSLLTDLTGDYARYSFAIIAMWQHANLSSTSRRITAMSDMTSLIYNGDGSKWKIEFVSRAREIFASGATIEHYIMQCAFHSFEGKNQQVQAMITNDINNEDTIYKGMNLEALASKYSSFVSTLQSGKHTGSINSAQAKKYCTKCKVWGHRIRDCSETQDPDAEGQDDTADQESGQSTRKAKKCDYCDRKGHTEEDCFLKKRHESAKTAAADSTPASPPADEPKSDSTAKVHSALISDTQVADIMSRLKTGEIKLPKGL